MLSFPKINRTPPNIHLTALIDIVFLLLIFFLLTSNFVTQQGISVVVPEVEDKADKISPDIVVFIDHLGKSYLDNQLLDHDKLYLLLRSKMQVTSLDTVLIQADRRVAYDEVIQVIDVAKLAGAKSLILVTEQKQNKISK